MTRVICCLVQIVMIKTERGNKKRVYAVGGFT